MSLFSCFPKKEKLIKKTFEIDLSFYEKLEYLTQEVYDTSINKMINVCLDNLFASKELNLYVKPRNEKTVARSLLIRKSLYDNLTKYKNKYNISYNKILNIAIHDALLEEGIIKK